MITFRFPLTIDTTPEKVSNIKISRTILPLKGIPNGKYKAEYYVTDVLGNIKQNTNETTGKKSNISIPDDIIWNYGNN
jgi:hypothetical protein